MRYPPRPARGPARFLFRRSPLAWSAAIVLVTAGLGWAGDTDLKYEMDARAGPTTAVITPSPVDTTFAFISITFADGAHEELGMENLIAMGGPNGWRMCIGTDVAADSGPPPAVMSPGASSPS